MQRGLLLAVTLSMVAFLVIPLIGCVICLGWFPLLGPAPAVTGSQEIATWEYEFADYY